MADAQQNIPLDEAEFGGEELPQVSDNYVESDIPWVKPGEYLSRSRTIEQRQPDPVKDYQKDAEGNVVLDENGKPKLRRLSFQIDFGSAGLEAADGTAVPFAPRSFMDTEKREVKYGGIGEASSVGKYLAAFPTVISTDELAHINGTKLKDALRQSAVTPVLVVVELEDDYRTRPEGAKPIRTKAFKKADGTYAQAIVIPDPNSPNGVRKVLARPRIARFRPVPQSN